MNRSRSSETVREVPVGSRLSRLLEVMLRMWKHRTIMLEGRTGIGKTEFVRRFCREHGLDVTVLDLAAMDPPDLTGLPQIVENLTHFAVPAWLPTEGHGVLFLDELNRAPLEVQQALYRLVLEGKLHEYSLPPGWVVWAAINPAEDDYQVTELDPALADRFRTVRVVADRDAWIEWADAAGLHPAVIALAREHEKILDAASPRAWERTAEVLDHLDADELRDDELLRDLCSDDLGEEWVRVLGQAARTITPVPPPDAAALLAGYATDPELRDLVVGYQRTGRTDRLASLTDRLADLLAGPGLAAMIARNEFDLARFELLLNDLHGDHRRKLQLALGNNTVAIGLVNVDAERPIESYRRSAALTASVARWAQDPLREHRALLVATAIAEHIEGLADVGQLRRRSTVTRVIAKLLDRLGDGRAVRLDEVLKRRGLAGNRRRKKRAA